MTNTILVQVDKETFWNLMNKHGGCPDGFRPNGEYITSDWFNVKKQHIGRSSKAASGNIYEITNGLESGITLV